MKKILLTLSLLLTFGLSFSAVAAQQDGVAAPDMEGIEAQVEGAESVYSRTFSVDFEALMATPDLDMATLDPSVMMRSISVQGITFDNEDNASAYIDDSRTALDEARNGDEPVEGMEDISVEDLEDFDKNGMVVTMDMPEMESAMVMVIFVDGNQVFQISVLDSDIDTARTTANDVTQFVIDAEVQDEAVSFSDDGTSTGGVFDRMPKAGDEIVGDLTGVIDAEIMAPTGE